MHRRLASLLALISGVAVIGAFGSARLRDVSGDWVLRVSGSAGTTASNLTLTQQGTALRGTNLSNMGTTRPVEGRVSGDSVLFAIPIVTGDDRKVSYAGVLVGPDSVMGNVDLAGTGEATFTASRKR